MFILVSKITYAVQYFCNFKFHEMILTKDKVRKKKKKSLNITFRHTSCVTWLVFYWKKYFHIGGSPYSEIWNIKIKIIILIGGKRNNYVFIIIFDSMYGLHSTWRC